MNEGPAKDRRTAEEIARDLWLQDIHNRLSALESIIMDLCGRAVLRPSKTQQDNKQLHS